MSMRNERINLLPWDRQLAVRREYVIRILVVALIFINVLIVAAGVLLLPTYALLTENINIKKERLASIESTSVSANEAAISARLEALSANITMLTKLEKEQTMSALLRKILAVPHLGVALSGFSFSPKNEKGIRSLSISGVAKTRDDLRSYQLALSSISFVRAANLPVSVYAKDSDIDFTIQVQLAL